MAKFKAGQHVQDYIECAGRPHYLYFQSGWGRDITVHQVAYIRRTPSNSQGADYGPVGQNGYPNIDLIRADRPGPIAIADDVVAVSFEYSCSGDFVAFAA